jgi:hypothetical protein
MAPSFECRIEINNNTQLVPLHFCSIGCYRPVSAAGHACQRGLIEDVRRARLDYVDMLNLTI